MLGKSVCEIGILRSVPLCIAILLTLSTHATLAQVPNVSTIPVFLPAVTYPTAGSRSYSVAVADVNRDGKPDLIVGDCCGGAYQGLVSVLLGNGDGTFQPAKGFNTGGLQAAVVAVGDLNGDGNPDAVVTNSYFLNTVGVLLGNGDGSFQPVVTYPSGGGGPWSVVIADMNADGKPDLVLAVSSSCYGCTDGALVAVLLGNGDGTFQRTATYSSGGYAYEGSPISAAVGDLNGDGKLDIAVTNECSGDFECSLDGSIGILLGNGDGTFQPVVTYPPKGAGLLSVAIGDVNGDGKQDLMVTNGCGRPGACSKGTISVLLGNGDGTFRRPVAYESGGYGPGAVVIADVNGDGKLDAVVANGCDLSTNGNCAFPTPGVVGVLVGNGDGSFQAPQVYGSGGYWRSDYVAVADVDGDTTPDILVVNLYGQPEGQLHPHGSVGVLLNNTPFCTAPPVVTLSATPKLLWPPNGEMVPVTVFGTIINTDKSCSVKEASYVVKDKYGEVQPSGSVTLAERGTYSFTVWLRASRTGTDLNGRLYTVTVSASNNGGKAGSHGCTIIVPHDQKH